MLHTLSASNHLNDKDAPSSLLLSSKITSISPENFSFTEQNVTSDDNTSIIHSQLDTVSSVGTEQFTKSSSSELSPKDAFEMTTAKFSELDTICSLSPKINSNNYNPNISNDNLILNNATNIPKFQPMSSYQQIAGRPINSIPRRNTEEILQPTPDNQFKEHMSLDICQNSPEDFILVKRDNKKKHAKVPEKTHILNRTNVQDLENFHHDNKNSMIASRFSHSDLPDQQQFTSENGWNEVVPKRLSSTFKNSNSSLDTSPPDKLNRRGRLPINDQSEGIVRPINKNSKSNVEERNKSFNGVTSFPKRNGSKNSANKTCRSHTQYPKGNCWYEVKPDKMFSRSFMEEEGTAKNSSRRDTDKCEDFRWRSRERSDQHITSSTNIPIGDVTFSSVGTEKSSLESQREDLKTLPVKLFNSSEMEAKKLVRNSKSLNECSPRSPNMDYRSKQTEYNMKRWDRRPNAMVEEKNGSFSNSCWVVEDKKCNGFEQKVDSCREKLIGKTIDRSKSFNSVLDNGTEPCGYDETLETPLALDGEKDKIYCKSWKNLNTQSKKQTDQVKFNEKRSVRTTQKSSKYQRIRDLRNIRGFIVNIHDSTNFDIDLDIPSRILHKYEDVICNEYTYVDVTDLFGSSTSKNSEEDSRIITGSTYRCRLKGIAINHEVYFENPGIRNKILIDIRKLIDRCDGWVTCTVSDIDVYQRLLIDIKVVTPTETINLKDYILDRMSDLNDPIFYPYAHKQYTKYDSP